MALPRWSVVWGTLLVWFGVLRLLESINPIEVNAFLWVGLFLVGGLAFAVGHAQAPTRWWAAVMAGFTLGLAAMIAWNHVGDGPPDLWGTSILFGGIGLGLLTVRARSAEYWWATPLGGFARMGRGPLRWPLVPAVVAGALGVAFALDAARSFEGLEVLWSPMLIAGGVYILFRAVARYRHTPTAWVLDRGPRRATDSQRRRIPLALP